MADGPVLSRAELEAALREARDQIAKSRLRLAFATHEVLQVREEMRWLRANYRRVLRYRISDQINAFVRKLPLVHRAAKQAIRWIDRIRASKHPAVDVPTPALAGHLDPRQAAKVLEHVPRQPLISIVVPVYRVAPRWLEEAIRSVHDQYYRNWELVLVDDASDDPSLTRIMEAWAARDPRIRHHALERNGGIVAATNRGIDLARGAFVGFLDHDDQLALDALVWIVAKHNVHPDAVWFYTDEDKIDADGNRFLPFHKPDFSPEYLLARMYTCHFSVYATDLLRQVAGLRAGFDGSQDHDLALRLSERVPARQVVHVPRVLYHWRAIAGSTADDVQAKPYAITAGLHAVRDALVRRNVTADVASHPLDPTLYQVRFHHRACPRTTLVIPTRNALPDLRRCLDSITRRTDYGNYDVVVIDNQSDDPALRKYLQREAARGRLRVMAYPAPFNHSDMNNRAVEALDSEFVVFMNNDLEVLSDGWLEQLLGTAELDPAIACVGALLSFPDHTIQHAGIILGVHGAAGHAHRSCPDSDPGYFGRAHSLQETSAATAALLLVRRSAFLQVGGFKAERYPTTFNDVDLCLRLRQAGFRCIYNPLVRGFHFESKTRRIDPETEDEARQRLCQDWGSQLANDPFYNPNLTLTNERFDSLRPYPVECDFPLELDFNDAAA